jgi:magnesium chelatase family protein
MDYQNRISGPLLDRIDLQVDVPPVTAADLALPPPAEGTAEAAARVATAREEQITRAGAAGRPDQALNARIDGALLDKVATPDEGGRALMTLAAEGGMLSARGWTRVLRLARTIADLDGSDAVMRRHVAESLIYRRTPPETFKIDNPRREEEVKTYASG